MKLSGILIVISFLCISCKQKQEQQQPKDDGAYFSIKQYIADQWKTYSGQPFGIIKYVNVNGKSDSVITNAYEVKWGDVFKIFFDTDISDPKFEGQYSFSNFSDDATQTSNYYYEAKSNALFTQKLQISADAYSGKIKSIYIETLKKNQWGGRTQRLFYIPVKTISIQEFESGRASDKKDLRVEYRFL
ncbi:MAG: hypothetical protein JST82_06010 [Bacteroidetes bacterium]|nr:hypothetical protein [Bacteroidota bacterium]